METEVKEKQEAKKGPVALTLYDIPRSVHNKMQRHQIDLTGKLRRKVTIRQAYVDFLKEAVKALR